MVYVWEVRGKLQGLFQTKQPLHWKEYTFSEDPPDSYTMIIRAEIRISEGDKGAAKKRFMKGLNLPLLSMLDHTKYVLTDLSAKLLNEEEVSQRKLPVTREVTIPAHYAVYCRLSSAFCDQLDRATELQRKLASHGKKYELESILRWINRAIDDQDMYDRFFSLWVAFNILFSTFSPARGDRHEAKTFALFLASQARNVVEKHRSVLESMLQGSYLFVRDSGHDDGSELQGHLKSSNYQVALESLIMCLYNLRCDLFHAGKPDERTTRNAFGILYEIVKAGFEQGLDST